MNTPLEHQPSPFANLPSRDEIPMDTCDRCGCAVIAACRPAVRSAGGFGTARLVGLRYGC